MQSLNEIEALAKRAARGAGFSWGLADEAGKAVRWLSAYGLPGPSALVDLLRLNDGMGHDGLGPQDTTGEWSGRAGRLCPIAAGAALSDFAQALTHRDAIALRAPSQPILLVPFATLAARQIGRAVVLSYDNRAVRCECDGPVDDALDDLSQRPSVNRMTCRIAVNTNGAARTRQRQEIAPDTWARLNEFAHRTLAPATEQSRALGAGSGLGDND